MKVEDSMSALRIGNPIVTIAKQYWGLLLDSVLPRRKLLKKMRSQWGCPSEKDSFMASRYFDLMHSTSDGTWVDDKTWNDLEFQEIFYRMDTTVTPVGSQVLFAQLRRYVPDVGALAYRYSTYMRLAKDAVLREALQLRLAKLSDDNNADLADVLFGEPLDESPNRAFIWTWSLLSLVLLISVAFFKIMAWFWLVALIVNVFVTIRSASREHRESEAMKHCANLLDAADELSSLSKLYPSFRHLERLRNEASNRAVVRKTLFWFALSKMQPFSVIFSVLNLAFLFQLIIQAGTIQRFLRIRSKLTATYELVGGIDATVAVASCLQQYPHHCLPSLTYDRELSITNGYHPLLPDGVSNSIRLDRRSALVTGSNMAGKTTFIKMLSSNAILAQTMGFCLAAAATIPRSTVMASIHGTHSVTSGKSHYFAEIEAIDSFIRDRARSGIKILAIDEPFSGTNTVERIAVARAVLESLGARAIVLTTTHDVELQDLLGDSYTLYHFQENPDVDGYFDYVLKRGPATARNAIRLLERMGFPEEIVGNAMSYAEGSVPTIGDAKHHVGRPG